MAIFARPSAAPQTGHFVRFGPQRAARIGTAQILDIGGQLEVASLLCNRAKLAGVELALPINLSLPPNLEVRPGELVDISLTPTTD